MSKIPRLRSLIISHGVGALGLLIGVCVAAPIAQDAKKTSWDGVYTEEQAQRGQKTYKAICGYCHGDDLTGAEAGPALIASFFRVRWRGETVANMFDTISSTMPKLAPSSLKPQEYVDIISFLLRENKMPAGNTELPTDINKLDEILITETPPQR